MQQRSKLIIINWSSGVSLARNQQLMQTVADQLGVHYQDITEHRIPLDRQLADSGQQEMESTVQVLLKGISILLERYGVEQPHAYIAPVTFRIAKYVERSVDQPVVHVRHDDGTVDPIVWVA